MLVVRRRPGEALLIGADIEVEILDCTPSQVKLGIRAPREIMVLRKEIRLTEEQNRRSAHGLSDENMDRLLHQLRRS